MITTKSNINTTRLESKLKKSIGNINKAKIEVGFINGAAYPDGTPVAEVAMINNVGTSKIPPRPFFTKALHSNKKKWIKFLKKGIINGKGLLGIKRTGELIRADIVKSITELDSPPNSPSTVSKKGSSNPLVDTSLLRKSVTYKIKKR